MNERGWFTLLVRGLGLWFTLSGISGAAYFVVALLIAWVNTPRNQAFAPLTVFGGTGWQFSLAQGLGQAATTLAGLYLLFRGGRLIDWLCRTVVGRCPSCGYRIQAGQPACPECGVAISSGR